jgi:hypothetical protein
MNETQERKTDSGLRLPAYLQIGEMHATETPSRPRAGDLCPECQSARLDYDGLLNLACPNCGLAAAGCFT